MDTPHPSNTRNPARPSRVRSSRPRSPSSPVHGLESPLLSGPKLGARLRPRALDGGPKVSSSVSAPPGNTSPRVSLARPEMTGPVTVAARESVVGYINYALEGTRKGIWP